MLFILKPGHLNPFPTRFYLIYRQNNKETNCIKISFIQKFVVPLHSREVQTPLCLRYH